MILKPDRDPRGVIDMNRPESYDSRLASDKEELANQARQAFLAQPQQAHAAHTATSVREVRYKGRRIRIETTYRITVDGSPVTGHIAVNNEGRVHYHSIPNQEFASAVDMVKRVIDLLPPETGATQPTQPSGPGHHH
jgi:hypothetical protein